MRGAAEGDESEESKELVEETKKEALKLQNFKGQAEIMSGFVVEFKGLVPLPSVNELAGADCAG